jgi:lipopolysaccharide/colanic/teichoic acid biosynthesis glycosyltransferase
VAQFSLSLDKPFSVLKLRTMALAPSHAPANWTLPGDRGITRVGLWLRRTRLDELPQQLNVLRGEISLIGLRPELEQEQQASILHYRKRHWMRTGLSGWAQVCTPYAASVEDSELNLSYVLHHLMHFSTWLDLVILLRTIQAV